MSVLSVRKFPDSVLKQVALPVQEITQATLRLIDDMVETMYAAPGVGLAAPQVGVAQRIIVLDTDHENPRRKLVKLINPVIRGMAGEVVWEEGCLSVVDFTAEVKRSAWVEVVGLNEKGKEMKIEGEGLLAVVLQHEIDHLDGVLFIDRISRLKRDLYKRRVKKRLREGRTKPEKPQLMI
jgi:peptide deformylase